MSGPRKRSARLQQLEERKNSNASCHKNPWQVIQDCVFGSSSRGRRNNKELQDLQEASCLQELDAINNDNFSSHNMTAKIIEYILDVFDMKDRYELFAMPDNIQVANYAELVNNPGDFATLRQKNNDGMYRTIEQFESDIYMVFNKAMATNQPATIPYKEAKSLQNQAKRVFLSLKNNQMYSDLEISTLHQKYINRPKTPRVTEGNIGTSSSTTPQLSTIQPKKRTNKKVSKTPISNVAENDKGSVGEQTNEKVSETPISDIAENDKESVQEQTNENVSETPVSDVAENDKESVQEQTNEKVSEAPISDVAENDKESVKEQTNEKVSEAPISDVAKNDKESVLEIKCASENLNSTTKSSIKTTKDNAEGSETSKSQRNITCMDEHEIEVSSPTISAFQNQEASMIVEDSNAEIEARIAAKFKHVEYMYWKNYCMYWKNYSLEGMAMSASQISAALPPTIIENTLLPTVNAIPDCKLQTDELLDLFSLIGTPGFLERGKKMSASGFTIASSEEQIPHSSEDLEQPSDYQRPAQGANKYVAEGASTSRKQA